MNQKRTLPTDIFEYESSEAPHVECPRCNKETFVTDYFEHGVGSELECDHCGAMLECIEEERPVVWTWRLKDRRLGAMIPTDGDRWPSGWPKGGS